MEHDIEVRRAQDQDAQELAVLLNQIIARGGTTALEEPFTPDGLAKAMLTGPHVICCFVAVERNSGRLLGFQSLERGKGLPADIGDVATFTRLGVTQRGVGSALFVATADAAGKKGLKSINATIRADNIGGLAFYGRMGFVDYSVQLSLPLKDGTPVDRIGKRYLLASK